MYHDQALIPIKTLAFDHAVNVTLGLPFVRTSPDHGTAFDIAGTGKADPSSLIAALKLAARLAAADARPRPPRARMSADRRPAAAARGHPPARPARARNRSARTSCSISISPAASRAPRARSTASTVVEIGPGPGGLTRALLTEGAAPRHRGRARRARHRGAGRDRGALSRAGSSHRGRRAGSSTRDRYLDGGPRRIVANLPYNIATALLVGWLTAEPWPPWYDRLVLMFQREVAERIVAPPGSKTYGRLSVLAGWRTRGENPVRRAAVGLRAAAEGDLVGGAS